MNVQTNGTLEFIMFYTIEVSGNQTFVNSDMLFCFEVVIVLICELFEVLKFSNFKLLEFATFCSFEIRRRWRFTLF